MPEGHTIHRLARQFREVFAGQRLEASSPQGRFAAGAALLDGCELTAAQAHGKQLFLTFSDADAAGTDSTDTDSTDSGERVLRIHLGLYGAWDFGGDSTFRGASSIGAPRRVGERELPAASETGQPTAGLLTAEPPPPGGSVRVRLVSAHGWADLRGPSACEVLSPVEAEALRARLGPDPLLNEPGDQERFLRLLSVRRTPIGTALMDQAVIAGVGNIYRAELLFRGGLNPELPSRTLRKEQAEHLWADARLLLECGVADGRIVTTEPADRSQPSLSPVPLEDAHYVYHREGLPCRRCRAVVRMREVAGRKLFWCPQCQS
ncbi:Fpg/Nei family DNA glycosylase [Psychromicrobium xiongbiense]|uniref:Fpg/Nei family DNA glycosylase n=1 Tax=Psychromicrobium xiongbiense TaxID=3051184 RepID=UPI0025521E5E|nr:zinc finger domain-containing protein [Psychromicrobium sp. YIM S02556]